MNSSIPTNNVTKKLSNYKNLFQNQSSSLRNVGNAPKKKLKSGLHNPYFLKIESQTNLSMATEQKTTTVHTMEAQQNLQALKDIRDDIKTLTQMVSALTVKFDHLQTTRSKGSRSGNTGIKTPKTPITFFKYMVAKDHGVLTQFLPQEQIDKIIERNAQDLSAIPKDQDKYWKTLAGYVWAALKQNTKVRNTSTEEERRRAATITQYLNSIETMRAAAFEEEKKNAASVPQTSVTNGAQPVPVTLGAPSQPTVPISLNMPSKPPTLNLTVPTQPTQPQLTQPVQPNLNMLG
jgi:hypothetical protein